MQVTARLPALPREASWAAGRWLLKTAASVLGAGSRRGGDSRGLGWQESTGPTIRRNLRGRFGRKSPGDLRSLEPITALPRR